MQLPPDRWAHSHCHLGTFTVCHSQVFVAHMEREIGLWVHIKSYNAYHAHEHWHASYGYRYVGVIVAPGSKYVCKIQLTTA